MFNVKESPFCAAPFEAPADYEPFFARKSIKMFPNSYSSHNMFSETKPEESTTENQEPNESIMPETSSSNVIDYGLVDDYPDPESESPYESDSDVDKLYLDLDPPSNYQRRASVNCFTVPIHKKATKDGPTALEAPAIDTDTPKEIGKEKRKKHKDRSYEKSKKSKDKSALKSNAKSADKSEDRKSRPERDEKERVKKSRDGKSKKRRHFANKSTQTELECVVEATTSSVMEQKNNLDQGREVMQPLLTQERVRGLGQVMDKIWQSRVKRPFGPQTADLRFSGEEPPAKRERGPTQEEDDSDMDPPIRTITQ